MNVFSLSASRSAGRARDEGSLLKKIKDYVLMVIRDELKTALRGIKPRKRRMPRELAPSSWGGVYPRHGVTVDPRTRGGAGVGTASGGGEGKKGGSQIYQWN